MKGRRIKSISFVLLFMFFFTHGISYVAAEKQRIYDFAELLTEEEVLELEALSAEYSAEREVDITILTIDDSEGLDIVEYVEDFYDYNGLGYERSHGNTVMLAVDLSHRDVYIAGFYKGEDYIYNERANMIREEITTDLSDGYFYDAFYRYIELTYEYLGSEPVNLFETLSFQIITSLVIATIVVGILLYRSSGRVTTSARTYLDENNSAVTKQRDRYIRTSVTKMKKPSDKGGSSGGGGGVTKAGHSHSGSRGKF